MLRVFLHYLPLVLAAMLGAIWSWSYLDGMAMRIGPVSVAIYDGVIFGFEGEAVSNAKWFWPYSLRSPNNLYFCGGVSCPLGPIVLAIVLLTACAWYRPVRDRLKRSKRVGFDVSGCGRPSP